MDAMDFVQSLTQIKVKPLFLDRKWHVHTQRKAFGRRAINGGGVVVPTNHHLLQTQTFNQSPPFNALERAMAGIEESQPIPNLAPKKLYK
jgi:hypothetical protein